MRKTAFGIAFGLVPCAYALGLQSADDAGARLQDALAGSPAITSVTVAAVGGQSTLLVHVVDRETATSLADEYAGGFEGYPVRTVLAAAPQGSHPPGNTVEGAVPGVRMDFETSLGWHMRTLVNQDTIEGDPTLSSHDPLHVEGVMTVIPLEAGEVEITLDLRRVTFWDGFTRWTVDPRLHGAPAQVDEIQRRADDRLRDLVVPMNVAQAVPFLSARCADEYLGLKIARAHEGTYSLSLGPDGFGGVPAGEDRIDRLFVGYLVRLARLAGFGGGLSTISLPRTSVVQSPNGFAIRLRGAAGPSTLPYLDAAAQFGWGWTQPGDDPIAIALQPGGTLHTQYVEDIRRDRAGAIARSALRLEIDADNVPFTGSANGNAFGGSLRFDLRFDGTARRIP